MSEFVNNTALNYLQTLESNSVDLILTDPPYAISRDTNFQSGEPTGKDTDRFRVSYNFGDWDVVDIPYFKEVFKEAYRVLRKGGTCIVWYDIWKIQELREILEPLGFRMFRTIEWIKTNPVPINSGVNYLSNAKEMAIVCVKGSKPTFNASYHKGVFEYPIYQGADRFHPTQKHLTLFCDLINIHTNEGDVVLDFFSGSATTQIAALLTGREYLGCEADVNIFKQAEERLNEYTEQQNHPESTD